MYQLCHNFHDNIMCLVCCYSSLGVDKLGGQGEGQSTLPDGAHLCRSPLHSPQS